MNRYAFSLALLVIQTAQASLVAYMVIFIVTLSGGVPEILKTVSGPVGWIGLLGFIGIMVVIALFVAWVFALMVSFPILGRWLSRKAKAPLPSFSLNVAIYPVFAGMATPVIGPYLLNLMPYFNESADFSQIPNAPLIAVGAIVGCVNAIALNPGFSWRPDKRNFRK